MGLLSKIFAWQPERPAVAASAPAMVSLVILSNTCVTLTLDGVLAIMDALFPGSYIPARDEGNFVAPDSEGRPIFGIHCWEPGMKGLYELQSIPGPYTAFSPFAEHITDPAIRALAEAQSSWLSVDRLHGYAAPEADGYRFIGKVLAALAPDDAAIVVHPSKLQSLALTPMIRKQMAAGHNPFEHG